MSSEKFKTQQQVSEEEYRKEVNEFEVDDQQASNTS